MSLDATLWAWKAKVTSSTQRLILLSLADRAGEKHQYYPSILRMVKDTKLNRKTIIKVLDDLEQQGFIKFTGQSVGNGVKVYQLLGVTGREDGLTSTKKGTSGKNGTSTNLGTGSNIGTSTENGTGTSTKNGTETSTKIGTQNLPRNLSIESKNKKGWFCWKKLESELAYLQDKHLIAEIKNASWFEREKTAFEKFNANTNLSDDLMIYHFADKLVQSVAKYRALETQSQNKTTPADKPNTAQLSEKQIFMFAQKISRLPEYAGKHGQVGESYEDLASRIAERLYDEQGVQSLMPYLKQVGYKQNGKGV